MPRNLISTALLSLFTVLAAPPTVNAASAYEIDAGVDETLDRFFYNIRGAEGLARKAVDALREGRG